MLGNCLTGNLDQLSKRLRIVDSHVGEHLAVELDAGPLQTVHEHGVGHAVLAGASVDAGDPELADLALLVAAIAVLVLERMIDLLLGLGVGAGLGTIVALRAAEDGAALLAGVDGTLNTSHDDSPLSCEATLRQLRKLTLTKAQVAGDDPLVGLGNHGLLAEVALTLGALLGEDVALVALGTHDLARTGHAETLGGTAMRLHLRHLFVLSLFGSLAGSLFLLLLGVCRQRGDEHMHVAPFHLRRALDDCDLITDIYLPDSVLDPGGVVIKDSSTGEYKYVIHCSEGSEVQKALDAKGIPWEAR